MSILGPILGLAGGIFGASQQQKAANAAAAAQIKAAEIEDKRIRELSAPYFDAAKYALPTMKNTVSSVLAPKVGQDSELLTAQHGLNLTGIGRSTNKALATSGMFWKNLGNTGKARGEALDIGRGATDATNQENLSYAGAQETFKNNNTMTFINALNGMVGAGQFGTQMAATGARDSASAQTSAAGIRAQGATNFWDDVGAGVGTAAGTIFGQQENEKLAKILAPAGTVSDWTTPVPETFTADGSAIESYFKKKAAPKLRTSWATAGVG